MVIIATIAIYLLIIIAARLVGPRAFSKMSSFDVAVTIAMGSVIANTIVAQKPPLLQAVVALIVLYLLQIAVSKVRSTSTKMGELVNSDPLLLMDGSEILEDNLKKARVTRADVWAKLRQANVTQLSQVRAMVMEATGDISVLHNDNPDHKVDEKLFTSVRGLD
jgi:uncharacterized membrane protein YcaP (DUF421 family)